MSENHVLFQTNEFVDFARQRGLCQHLGCFLEGGRTDKAVRLNRSLGDSQQLGTGRCTFWTLAFSNRATQSFDLGIGLLKRFFWNDRFFRVITITWVGDFDALAEFFIRLAELETVHDQTRQQISVTRGFDFHLSKHACDDDLAMLVINLNLLRLINLLNFVQQVLLNGFFTRDTQNVVWDEWSINQCLSGFDDVATMHLEVLSVGHKMFAFDA